MTATRFTKTALLTALPAAALAVVPPAAADTITLSATVRDFKVDHPDMQYPDKSFGVKRGLVKDTLSSDNRPMLKNSHSTGEGMISGADSFNQWFRDVEGVNIPLSYTLVLDNGQNEPGGLYKFAVEKPHYFFPIDGEGWKDTATDANGNQRNFYFTLNLEMRFTYTDPATRDLNGNGITGEDEDALVFSFTGDDDVWAFINGKLVVDIGGVHGQASDSVNVDEMAEELGLQVGESYPLHFFFAERHTTQSNFRIETTLRLSDADPLYD